MAQLIRYDAMCRAIAAAHAVDEIKEIRDQAVALEHYARQAKNEELERWCREIRERAERRWGELYKPAKGRAGPGRGKAGNRAGPAFNEEAELVTMGVSKRQSVKWQARAAIPKQQFEAALAAGKSTDSLIKQHRRGQRIDNLQEATARASSALGSKLYNVLYVDPPWDWAPWSRETGMDRAAANHYPVMTTDAIKALKVPAADDSVLFLWATAPMERQAHDVIDAWGFVYKSQGVWVKPTAGLGYWFRNQHEPLLVATRGNIPAPPEHLRAFSVFHAPAGRHSEKPEIVAQTIERYYPDLPKLEMFARRARLGWDVFGNEAEAAE